MNHCLCVLYACSCVCASVYTNKVVLGTSNSSVMDLITIKNLSFSSLVAFISLVDRIISKFNLNKIIKSTSETASMRPIFFISRIHHSTIAKHKNLYDFVTNTRSRTTSFLYYTPKGHTHPQPRPLFWLVACLLMIDFFFHMILFFISSDRVELLTSYCDAGVHFMGIQIRRSYDISAQLFRAFALCNIVILLRNDQSWAVDAHLSMQQMTTVRLTGDCIVMKNKMNRITPMLVLAISVIILVICLARLQENSLYYCFVVLNVDLSTHGYFLVLSITSDYSLYYCLRCFSRQLAKAVKMDIHHNRFSLQHAHQELSQFALMVHNFNRYLAVKYSLNILLVMIFPSLYYSLFQTNLNPVIKVAVGCVCVGLIVGTMMLSNIIGKVDDNVAILNEAVYRYLCIDHKCTELLDHVQVRTVHSVCGILTDT